MKPILFNTDMVRSILNGYKSTTRRVILPANQRKASPEGWRQNYTGLWIDTGKDNSDKTGHIKDYSVSPMWWTLPSYIQKYAPYKAGDILYVREKFCIGSIAYGEEPDGRCVPYVSQCTGDDNYIPYEYCIRHDIGIEDVIWKPCLHMPKEAARVFLKVKDIHVEALQDIDMEGVRQEGLTSKAVHAGDAEIARQEFSALWNSTLKKENKKYYEWDKNPYVWVISFETCENPE